MKKKSIMLLPEQLLYPALNYYWERRLRLQPFHLETNQKRFGRHKSPEVNLLHYLPHIVSLATSSQVVIVHLFLNKMPQITEF